MPCPCHKPPFDVGCPMFTPASTPSPNNEEQKECCNNCGYESGHSPVCNRYQDTTWNFEKGKPESTPPSSSPEEEWEKEFDELTTDWFQNNWVHKSEWYAGNVKEFIRQEKSKSEAIGFAKGQREKILEVREKVENDLNLSTGIIKDMKKIGARSEGASAVVIELTEILNDPSPHLPQE